jgi:hypothetical protein
MVKDRHIDSEIFNLVLESDILQEYASKHMDPSQVDDPEIPG